MNYEIYINQKKPNPDMRSAANEYIKRLAPFCHVTVSFCKKPPVINKNKYNVLLLPDDTGTRTISSEAFAEKINQMAVSSISNVRFYIGFSDSDEFDEIFSVTGMSLSDEILLIAFTEQLYRAYTIQNHITYHK